MQLDGIFNHFDIDIENSFRNAPDNCIPIAFNGTTGNLADYRWINSVQRGPKPPTPGSGGQAWVDYGMYQKKPYKGKFKAIEFYAFGTLAAGANSQNNFINFAPYGPLNIYSGSQFPFKNNEYPFAAVINANIGVLSGHIPLPLDTELFNCTHDLGLFVWNNSAANNNANIYILGYIDYGKA